MPVKRHFRDTIMEKAQKDKEFRQGLLLGGFSNLLFGETSEDAFVGRSTIRDYINATIGFDQLAKKTGINAKSLMRMLGTTGNPRTDSLRAIMRALFEHEGLETDSVFDASHIEEAA